MNKAPRKLVLLGLVAMIAVAVVLPVFQVCRDWAFIDQNTGSRKGHRDWFFGWRTSSWYQATALETFMRNNHLQEFRQAWTSYAGTGRNIFGGATLHGHGRPSRIILLTPQDIDGYCGQVSDVEKERLYDVLASGESEEINRLVDQINGAAIGATQQKPIQAVPGEHD